MFPRQIVISPNYGTGLSSEWHIDEAYDIIESDILIQAVNNKTTITEVVEALIDAGYPESIEDLNWYGWRDATVITVNGPYRVVEYDGWESVEMRDSIKWRT